MRAYCMNTALAVLLAGAALSANAKPSETQQWVNLTTAGSQDSALTVAIGPAGKVAGKRKDYPISVVKPG